MRYGAKIVVKVEHFERKSAGCFDGIFVRFLRDLINYYTYWALFNRVSG